MPERFGRDQHQTLICKLFHIHQESIVSDYISQFSILIDKLKAYNPNIHMLYYTTRFVDGLREDIRDVVVAQRPQNLDTAYTLALLRRRWLIQGSTRTTGMMPCHFTRFPSARPLKLRRRMPKLLMGVWCSCQHQDS